MFVVRPNSLNSTDLKLAAGVRLGTLEKIEAAYIKL